MGKPSTAIALESARQALKLFVSGHEYDLQKCPNCGWLGHDAPASFPGHEDNDESCCPRCAYRPLPEYDFQELAEEVHRLTEDALTDWPNLSALPEAKPCGFCRGKGYWLVHAEAHPMAKPISGGWTTMYCKCPYGDDLIRKIEASRCPDPECADGWVHRKLPSGRMGDPEECPKCREAGRFSDEE